MLVGQSVGAVAGALIVVVSGEAPPAALELAWAALAGIAGLGGLYCFYRALSGGTMALIAPLAGVIGAAVPAAVAVIGGEQLSAIRLVGLVGALTAIVLISLPSGLRSAERVWHLGRNDLLLTVLAGLGFAGFFLFLDRSTVSGATWWPLLTVRLVGLAVLCGTVIVVVGLMRGSLRERVSSLLGLNQLTARAGGTTAGLLVVTPVFVLGGAGDLGGNVFFLFANQHDALAVAVVLSSLYPIVTAVLAAALLGERLGRLQVAGVVLAVVAAALIGVG
jgi:drug/metabolite transporter (DMT)-like permease